MLVIARKKGQTIRFPDLDVEVKVCRLKRQSVTVGIDAPRSVEVLRGELDNRTSLAQAGDLELMLREFQSKFFASTDPHRQADLLEEFSTRIKHTRQCFAGTMCQRIATVV